MKQDWHEVSGTSLDLLYLEDRRLADLFRLIEVEEIPMESEEDSVERRSAYGMHTKDILRHFAVRQACAIDVASGIKARTELAPTSDEIRTRAVACRALINETREMHRKVDPLSLNVGQDFDGSLNRLMDTATSTIEWELTETIPAIRSIVTPRDATTLFKSARYVRNHAPTRLNPAGPRWYENAPLVSRLLTIYEHLKEFHY